MLVSPFCASRLRDATRTMRATELVLRSSVAAATPSQQQLRRSSSVAAALQPSTPTQMIVSSSRPSSTGLLCGSDVSPNIRHHTKCLLFCGSLPNTALLFNPPKNINFFFTSPCQGSNLSSSGRSIRIKDRLSVRGETLFEGLPIRGAAQWSRDTAVACCCGCC